MEHQSSPRPQPQYPAEAEIVPTHRLNEPRAPQAPTDGVSLALAVLRNSSTSRKVQAELRAAYPKLKWHVERGKFVEIVASAGATDLVPCSHDALQQAAGLMYDEKLQSVKAGAPAAASSPALLVPFPRTQGADSTTDGGGTLLGHRFDAVVSGSGSTAPAEESWTSTCIIA